MVAASVSEATLRDSRIFGHGFSLDQDTFFVWSEQRKTGLIDTWYFNSLSVSTLPISLFSSHQHLSGLANTFPLKGLAQSQ